MTTEERVAGMMAQLLVDAPRTVDLAFARFVSGRTRTAGLLSDALGVLAALPPGDLRLAYPLVAAGPTLGLGRPGGPTRDGETERVDASSCSSSPREPWRASLGHRWDIRRDPGGSVVTVLCDGKPVTLAELRLARTPLTEGGV